MRITIKIENKYIGWLYVSYTLLKMIFETKKICTLGGARTHDHKIKSLALYHLSYEGFNCDAKMVRRPGIEPGPPAWKAGILTTELTTLTVNFHLAKGGESGFRSRCLVVANDALYRLS